MEFCDVILHLQVVVPPSAKALNWFCCQPESSAVFPQFFLSKEKANQITHSLSGLRGIFGIGAAILFKGSSYASQEWSSLERLISSYLLGFYLELIFLYLCLAIQIECVSIFLW